jgi:magnesium-dependent phosphatase 1
MTKLPSMIVFDLDDCLWTPEMHELPGCPELPVHGKLNPNYNNSTSGNSNGNGKQKQQTGVVGLQVLRYRDTVTLYDGARRVLYELATNPVYKGVLLATASSSLEPSYSYACLAGIEILPGLTMGDMMSFNQIGRTGNLSPDKTSHFRELHDESGVPYNEMLFFDDWCVKSILIVIVMLYCMFSERNNIILRFQESNQNIHWNVFCFFPRTNE